MKPKEQAFDISNKDMRRKTVCYIANILCEIYFTEEDILQELLMDIDDQDEDEDENDEIFKIRYVMDELLDISWTLANLYE